MKMLFRLAAYAMKGGFFLILVLFACMAGVEKKSAIAQDQDAQTIPETSSRGQEIKTGAVDCKELAALIQQEKTLVSRETGQIKREIAALRDDLARPGIREIFAGIGYILGLAGIGFYFHSRGIKGN
jgi:hypothetical protein